jgi:hypothetical protein
MWKGRLLSIAILLATPAMAQIEPAAAQEPRHSATHALPSDEQLDALLAARKWDELADALSNVTGSEARLRSINWLKAKIEAGGGFPLVIFYARDLWNAGQSNPIADPDKDPRVTAGFMILYAYVLILVDGAKCADNSAPGHRLDQLFEIDAPILKFILAKPKKLKDKIINGVVGFEKATAPSRQDDDVLCRGGLDEIMAGLQEGTTHKETTPAGQVGQSYAVQPPAGYAPRFLPPKEYLPLQAKERAGLKADLTQALR